jgi:hypothetical protein
MRNSSTNVFKQCWHHIRERRSDNHRGFVESVETLTLFFNQGAMTTPNPNSGLRRTVDRQLESTAILMEKPQSLADLDPNGPSSLEGNVSASLIHYHFDFNERRHAALVATALQAAIYKSSQLPLASFCTWQRSIESLLIHAAPVMKSVVSSAEALIPLSQLLQLTAAQGYLGLLVNHGCRPLSENTFCVMLRLLQNSAHHPINKPLSLPLGPCFPHIHACWRTSLSLLQWAAHFRANPSADCVEKAFITERDIEYALRSVVFNFGERSSPDEGGPRSDGGFRDQLVRKIQQLDVSCGSTNHRSMTVMGKKFEMTSERAHQPPNCCENDVTTHMASEALFAGKWKEVLSTFSRLMDASKFSNSMEKLPLHRTYFRCTNEQRQLLRTILRESGNNHPIASAFEAQSRLITNFHFRHVVPPSTPRSLVRFEGLSTYRALSYVERSPLWEMLPFAVVSGLCSGCEAVLSSVRDELVAPLLRIGADRYGPVSWSRHYQSLGDLITIGHAVNFVSLMEPDLSRHRRISREMYRPWWMPLELLRACVASATSSPSQTPPAELRTALRDCVPNSLAPVLALSSPLRSQERLATTAHSWDNYWLSAWIEIMCGIGPLDTTMRLIALLLGTDVSLGRGAGGSTIVAVLSPECAVAFASAVISLATHSSNPPSPQLCAKSLRLTLGLPEFVVFVAPAALEGPADFEANGAGSVRRYFRWIHRPEFYSRVAADDIVDSTWDGALGMLGGRIFRISTHLPTISHNESQSCRMTLWRLHVDALFEFGISVGQRSMERQSNGSIEPSSNRQSIEPSKLGVNDTAAVALVASFDHHTTNVRTGTAVAVLFKPSGVSTTLHHSGLSVSTFLARNSLWWCPPPANCAPNSFGDDLTGISVLAQEGLVNRIDRGTSGLVIAACNPRSLFHQRRIQLVQQGSKKTYYAIVVHTAPSDRAVGAATLWTAGSCPFFLPPRGVIGGEVFAEGSRFVSRLQLLYQGQAAAGSERPSDGGRRQDRREASTTFSVVEAFFPFTKSARRSFLPAPHYLVRVQLTSGR